MLSQLAWVHSLTPFLSSCLRAILSRDRRTYGVEPGAVADPPSVIAIAGDESLIQQRVEDLIETPGSSAVSQGPQDVVDT